jgi:hypothetical protein
VFIFLYFESRSPFILDLLCLVRDLKLKMIKIKIQDKNKQRNPQYTRHKRSKIKGDLDTKFENTKR